MLTQSAPAVVNALAGVLPDNAMRALTQALGNCNQPLAHRGPVSLSPARLRETGPGYATGEQWNPQSYESLLPTAESAHGVDVPGWDSPGGWGSGNYYGDTFNFPTNQEFVLNSYFGGPNFYNAGDQYVANTYSNTTNSSTTNTTNLNVTYINGVPVRGPAGPQGKPGAAGAQGRPGIGGGKLYSLQTASGQVDYLTGAPTSKLNPAGIQFLEFNTTQIQTYTGEGCVDDECKITLTPGPLVTVVTGLKNIGTVEIGGLQQKAFRPLIAARLVAIN